MPQNESLPSRQTCLPLGRHPYCEPSSCHDPRSTNIRCVHCNALHGSAELPVSSRSSSWSFGTCCQHGEVELPPLLPPPPFLRSILTGTTADAEAFRANIRQYNMALAFTSLGVKDDKQVNNRRLTGCLGSRESLRLAPHLTLILNHTHSHSNVLFTTHTHLSPLTLTFGYHTHSLTHTHRCIYIERPPKGEVRTTYDRRNICHASFSSFFFLIIYK